MALDPGTRFGPYEIVEQIGSGGMGEVWRARDAELNRDVAVKVLPRAFDDDTDRLARFKREAEILASLNHSNIATIHGLEKADDQTVIVMELIEGPTLADRIKDGPIPPDEAMGISLQIVAALEAAHGKGIVHRDLKPANVKVREDGTVKVLDFGISKPLDPTAISGGSPVMTTPAVTQTGVILGTAAYMSPEQARGKFVDQRTDIWAFGCLLFEMLTGQPAFGGEDIMLTLARVLDRETDLNSIPGTISPAVRHTLKLCLEKDPKKRIADIRDVKLSLEGAFEPEFPRSAGLAVSRPRWRQALPLAAAVVVTAVIVGAGSRAVLAPREAEVVRFTYPIPDGQAINTQGFLQLAVSPDGNEILYADENSGTFMRRRVGELEAQPIPGTTGIQQLRFPHYLPDGRSIVFAALRQGAPAATLILPANGGQLTTVMPELLGWPVTAGVDGMLYWSESEQCSFYRVGAGGGEPEPLGGPETGQCPGIWLLPGGEHLIVDYYPDGLPAGGEIVSVYDIAAQTMTELFPGGHAIFIEPGFIIYFDAAAGIMARVFDPSAPHDYGPAVPLVQDVLPGRNGIGNFAVSHDGSTLVYVKGNLVVESEDPLGQELTVVDESGAVDHVLGLSPRNYAFPSVSPDGRWLAVQAGQSVDADIYIYDLAGGAEERRLFSEGSNVHPAWAADSESIVFASDHEGVLSIYQQAIAGGGRPVRLTTPGEGFEHRYPAFDPEGLLTYTELTVGDGGGGDIFVLSADGEPTPLLVGQGRQWITRFSPTMGAVLYTDADFTVPRSQVFVRRYPGDTLPVQVSDEDTIAGSAVFSRDGSTVAMKLSNGQFEFVDLDENLAVSNRRSAGFRGPPRNMQRRHIESYPGGLWLVMLQPQDTAGVTRSTAPTSRQQELVIVRNIVTEIERRLGVGRTAN